MRKVIIANEYNTHLSRYIMGAARKPIVTKMYDFRRIEDNVQEYGSEWVLQSGSTSKIYPGKVEGLVGGTGSITLIYGKPEDEKDLLGVTIHYSHISDYDHLDRFNEEKFHFVPYGDRWNRVGLKFPDIPDIINKGGANTVNMLNSEKIQNKISTALNKIEEAIRKAK